MQFEQLARDVAGGTRSLFASLRLPLTESTVQFLLRHTGQEGRVAAELLGPQSRLQLPPQDATARRLKKQKRNPLSTYRNSSRVVQDWRRTMRYSSVKAVQLQCAETLSLMGLRVFETQADLRNLSIPLEVVT